MQKEHLEIPLSHWSILQARLIWAYRSRFAYRRWHYVPTPDVAWLIRSGEVRLEFESGVEIYQAGNWVFPKNAPAMQEFSDDTEIFSVRFHAAWSAGVPLFERKQSYALPVADAPGLTRDAERLIRMMERIFPENSQRRVALIGDLDVYLMIQPLVIKYVASYYFILKRLGAPVHIPGIMDDRVGQALDYIEKHPMNSVLHEMDIARHIGMSVSQLNRIFARSLGLSPAAIWTKKKLDAARLQLLQNSLSIKEIAGNLGFATPEHFSNWFRKQSKLSPRKYRQTFQSGAKLV